MNDKWIIALDQGTSSCRAFAVDAQGKVRAQKNKVFSPHRPQKGLSFYNAEELLAAQLGVLYALLDEIGPEKAAALAICSQRSTVVLWDKNTGYSLAPALTWEDGRSFKEKMQYFNRVNEVLEHLPGYDCSACGMQTCRIMAEEIAKGRKDLSNCRILSAIKGGSDDNSTAD